MNHHYLIAIDLAKNIFQVCIVNSNNRVIMNRQYTRASLNEFIAHQPPTTVAMEACYSSHYWARLFQSYGHQVKLIPAQHVKPFVRGNKNDHNDALAITVAACRPHIRPVPVKTVAQQDIQSLHRLRERMVSQRTSKSNQTRGLLRTNKQDTHQINQINRTPIIRKPDNYLLCIYIPELIMMGVWLISLRLFEREPVSFRCSCSSDRVKDMIRNLGLDEAQEIIAEEGAVHVTCEFCNAQYHFDAVDVDMLFTEASHPGDSQTRH